CRCIVCADIYIERSKAVAELASYAVKKSPCDQPVADQRHGSNNPVGIWIPRSGAPSITIKCGDVIAWLPSHRAEEATHINGVARHNNVGHAPVCFRSPGQR